MDELAFHIVLRDTLLTENRTPLQFAREIGVQAATVAQWLSGGALPQRQALAKILINTQHNHFELLYSATYNSYLKTAGTGTPRPFKFWERASVIVADVASSSQLDDDAISRLFAIFENVYDYDAEKLRRAAADTSPESEIIVLPSPSIAVVNQWRKVIELIKKDHTELHNLNWKAFEDLVGHLLEDCGWTISPMGYTKDGGVDLIAARTVPPHVQFTMMVQCKKYRRDRSVGVSVVKDVWATKWDKGFNHAMIATTSFFTRGAIEKAEQWNFDMRDHDAIVHMCTGHGGIVV
jgi:HJR/Mrr/RecB family endonuclease